jgi:hypothetical protein
MVGALFGLYELTQRPGHSWSPVFGRSDKKHSENNGDILISTLGLIDASVLPNFTSLPTDIFQPRAKDLNSIVVVDYNYVKGPPLRDGKKYVRVGTSTTNEQLRRWCIKTGKVTMPMNIVEVEITMGGSNATIWYGHTQSVSGANANYGTTATVVESEIPPYQTLSEPWNMSTQTAHFARSTSRTPTFFEQLRVVSASSAWSRTLSSNSTHCPVR